ncbi:protoporphyrinogen oxidase [Hymenobacter sp. UV11]|uniref:protoporphyrinogen oxidase n=1 Tax=Hymenobacter sp. UV11 TaxID=1849735 RepID=UPI001061276C|nr:protoporphyrinogen oxidase [Hymenobacter sp. UV11]TDN37829.1 protoporphyrinogen oxidase [Hymenobacter sp. UV11]TFZ65039.1 protoporphyrinogen oxidase [Hymenobacter sp. UV11]
MRIAIIGGGLTGLTLAYYLQKAGVTYDLFEASGRPGGNLLSPYPPAGYQLEAGPNSLLLSPELDELLTELGLQDHVQEAAPVSQHRYVLRGGEYRALPASPPALLASPFFSWRTKLGLLSELLRRPTPPVPGETVAAFFSRHFGNEVVQYAVNPFVAGIYAGDPAELLLSLTFPQLAVLEEKYGSLLRGLAKGPKTARRRTITLRGGVQALTDALAARLTSYHPGQAVTAVNQLAVNKYQLTVIPTPSLEYQAPSIHNQELGTRNQQPETTYSHLALALPAYAAAELLAPHFAVAAAALAAVRYPPMTLVYSAYDRTAVTHPLEGFGALNPRVEGTYSAGSIWTSSLFPDRVPAGQVLFTSFVGGAQFARQAQEPEEEQLAAVHQELSQLYGIAGAPRWQGRYYWPRSIPQFDRHLAAARAAMAPLAAQGIVPVANWQAGVSVPDCVKYARRTAEQLVVNNEQ